MIGLNNVISKNEITKNNNTGISLWEGYNAKINNNNIFSNKIDYKNEYSKKVNLNGNYWGEPRVFPKFILSQGRIYLFTYYPRIPVDVYFYYLKPEFDWHPAQEPYDI
jgi:parallel beta-helix repeat protein